MANYYNYGVPNGYPNVSLQQQAPQTMGLIEVRSEDEVLRYPVAPGNSVSFRNVTEPYIYTKTMVSQFGAPVVEKYRLVREGAPEPKEGPAYATKDELAALAATVAALAKKVPQDE